MIGEGSRLGPYEIISRIGAGGMGEVWKARDTRLERSVAVKILPAEFAASTQLKLRFEREAKTISQLNHPNICTLHDVGHENGTDFLVMELVEGETLADRLARGPLPIQDVVRYGAQIADALDRAHRAGVVHRDLKPGNIMLTRLGTKLLDFGLAKSGGLFSPSGEHARGDGDTALKPSKPLTEQGTILGTFQYMSPEQLEGEEADARSDIFSFGAVLYEMTTGHRAFEGKTRTSLIAAIIDRDPPPITTVQPLSPPALERVIRTCLAKNPDERWQSAHDIAAELRWIADAGSQAGVAPVVTGRRKRREVVAWVVAGLALAAIVPLGIDVYRQRTRPRAVLHASVLPPLQSRFTVNNGLAVSPDGKKLAFVATSLTGESLLWVRPLDSTAAQPLGGTTDASFPFWSPDSRQVAFFASGKLKRVDVGGGPSQTICAAVSGRGGSWSKSNTILFAQVRDSLYQVPASGGSPVKVTNFDAAKGEADHRWPFFLPDGMKYLFLARAEDPEESVVWLGELGSNQKKRIVQSSGNVTYAGGKLLYTRERTLLSQPFDVDQGVLRGDPRPIAEQVTYVSGIAGAYYSASDGILVYSQGTDRSQLTWFDIEGRELGRIGEPAEYGALAISPDGSRLAVDVADSTGKTDVWVHDLNRSTASRFTFKPFDEFSPVWSPDGEQIIFAAGPRRPAFDVVSKPARASGVEQVLWEEGQSQRVPISWKNGKILTSYHDPQKRVVNDLWLYSMADRKGKPLIQSSFTEGGGSLSPDAEWFVYQSNESGKIEIYAQGITQPGKWQISTNGGFGPKWSDSGTEIYYVTLDRKLVVVPVRRGKTLEVGDPRTLFEMRTSQSGNFAPYDVTPDGKRVLVAVSREDSNALPMNLVANWAER